MRLSEGSFCEAGIPCLACRGLRCAQSGSCRGSGNAQAGQAVAYGLDGCLVRSDRAPGSPSQWLLHASCLAPPSRQACREPPSGALCMRKVGHQRHAAQDPERRILPRATTAYLVCPPRAPRKVLQGQPRHQKHISNPQITKHSTACCCAKLPERQAGNMCPCSYSLGVVSNRSPELLLHSKLETYELHARSFLG